MVTQRIANICMQTKLYNLLKMLKNKAYRVIIQLKIEQ